MAAGHFSEYKASDWLYSFTGMDLVMTNGESEEAFRYPLATVVVRLSQNGLPSIKMVIDATKIPETDDEPRLPAADPKKGTLAGLLEVHDEIQQMVHNDSWRAGLSISVTSEVDFQDLNIADWVVVGGGIEGLSASGAFAVGVTIQHKIVRATRALGQLPNLSALLNIPSDLAIAAAEVAEPSPIVPPTNPVGAYIQAIRAYISRAQTSLDDVTTPEEGASMRDLTKTLVERLTQAVADLEDNLEWDAAGGSDFPFPDIGEVSEYIDDTFWAYAGLPTDTPWGAFSKTVAGAYEFTVNGTANDARLIVSPFAPWGKSMGVIYDDEIYDLQLPSVDGYPVAGVIATFDRATQNELFSILVGAVGGDKAEEILGGHTIEEVTSSGGFLSPIFSGAIGRVEFARPPEWVAAYLTYQTSRIGEEDHPLDKGNVEFTMFEGETSIHTPEAADFDTYRELINIWCKQAFFRLFRRGMGVSIGTRLMLQSPDMATPAFQVRPGVTMEIRSREDDAPIIFFYVTEVHHTMDAQGKQAHTNIVGNYVRPNKDISFGEPPEEGESDGSDGDGVVDGGIEPFILTAAEIVAGVPNPLYESAGELGAETPTGDEDDSSEGGFVDESFSTDDIGGSFGFT